MARTNINTLKRQPDAIGPNDEKMWAFVGPMKEGDMTLQEIVDNFPEILAEKYINLTVNHIWFFPKLLEAMQYCGSNTDWKVQFSGWRRMQ